MIAIHISPAAGKFVSLELHSTVVLGGKIILDAFTRKVDVKLADKVSLPSMLVRVARNGPLRTESGTGSSDANVIGFISTFLHSKESDSNT